MKSIKNVQSTLKTGRFDKILVAVDGSGNSNRAARAAITLCDGIGAELSVVQAIPRPQSRGMNVRLGPLLQDYYASSVKEAQKSVQNIVELAKKRGLRVTGEVLKSSDSTVETILNYAENKGVDLIVVGTRGLGGFTKLIMGSVSTGIVNHASCSVLIVR
ncbi:MAG TPA: universal stress protein [Candidatus Saccharimonadales bacterium]|nr:universal stress protein [Candidatus Saccharimonadales bacterium]